MYIKKYVLSRVVGGLRTFLGVEVGVMRGGDPTRRDEAGPAEQRDGQTRPPSQNLELEQARRLLADRDRELARLRAVLDHGDRGAPTGGVKPENIVWIFGTGRSGNTWLSSVVEEMGHAVWREPSVGRLFGEFYYFNSREGQRGTSNYVLGEKQRNTWLRSIRNFVLEGADGRFPGLGDRYLLIKEQVGSVGAPLLMEALPESRMIMLIRDPRDVVASWMDATRKGGWRHERLDRNDRERNLVADGDLTAFVTERANHYLKNVSKAWEAYRSHEGPKVLVRYEELRAEPLDTMRRIFAELGMEVGEADLVRAVEKHAWENLPAEEKGEGKFHRKAKPGGWQEDLTEEQAKTVERVTAPLLKEFYPE